MEILEGLLVIFLHTTTIEISQSQPRLPDGVAFISRLLEILERRLVILRHERRSFRVHFAQVSHGVGVAGFGSAREVMQGPFMVDIEATAALIVELAETDLSLYVAEGSK